MSETIVGEHDDGQRVPNWRRNGGRQQREMQMDFGLYEHREARHSHDGYTEERTVSSTARLLCNRMSMRQLKIIKVWYAWVGQAMSVRLPGRLRCGSN